MLRASFAILSPVNVRWTSFVEARRVQMPENVLHSIHLIICCQSLTLFPLFVSLGLVLRSTFTPQNHFTFAHHPPVLSRNFPHQVP